VKVKNKEVGFIIDGGNIHRLFEMSCKRMLKYRILKWNLQGNGPIRHVETGPDFFFTARVHTTEYTVKILAANTHCKYFLKIAEHGQYCSLFRPLEKCPPLAEQSRMQQATWLTHCLGFHCVGREITRHKSIVI
jgi:hypothetical protein